MNTMTSLAAAVLVGLAGCSERAATPAPPAAPSETKAPTDAWAGRWNGPEGTFLEVAGGQGAYDVTVRNLDGPRTFKGQADGAAIRFERDGKAETLKATDGAGTGMKWLAEKKDCLVVAVGEGYCRD